MHPKIPLDNQRIEAINQAAARAADRTAARIVPVVAYRCGRYDRAEDLVGLWSAAIALTLILAFFLHVPFRQVLLSQGGVWRMGLLPVLATIAVGFGCGALLLTQIGRIRRLFIPRGQLRANVRSRAQGVYDNLTSDRPGPRVVVFVSVYEQRACLLADPDMQAQLDTRKLEAMGRALGRSVKSGQLDVVLCQTVSALADMLSPICPPQPHASPRSEPLAVL